MKFLVDNQLPPVLARCIRTEFGAEARHVADVGLQEGTDAELWAYASKTDAVLISKDDDFVRFILTTPTARLIWVRTGNCRSGHLLNVFRRVWPRVLERLDNNDRFIEVR